MPVSVRLRSDVANMSCELPVILGDAKARSASRKHRKVPPVDVNGRSTSPDARHSQISIEAVRLRSRFLAFRQVDSVVGLECCKDGC